MKLRLEWGTIFVAGTEANSNVRLARLHAYGHEDFEADLPLGGLAGFQGDHTGVHGAPDLAERVSEVELVFDGYELHCGRGIHLDGLDLRGDSFDGYAVIGGRIDDLDGDDAILPVKLAPVVVIEVLCERDAAGGAKVVLGSVDGLDLAGGEDVVVAVDFGHVATRECGCEPACGRRREG